MELYTSLTQLKMAMNGGTLPPMTPVPENAQAFIDPTSVPGLGALTEDVGKGLLCPIKACGVWRHSLKPHLSTAHADIGGAQTIMKMLSIPPSVSLVSAKFRENYSEQRRQVARENLQKGHASAQFRQARVSAQTRQRQTAARMTSVRSINARNLADQCLAQLSHKILDLSNQLGRSPSVRECRVRYGRSIERRIVAAFGSWNNALAQVGLRTRPYNGKRSTRKHIETEAVLSAIHAWWRQHGELPMAKDAQSAARSPYIPCWSTVKRALGAETWDVAMERAAALLDIHGGRYGLPERAASQ